MRIKITVLALMVAAGVLGGGIVVEQARGEAQPDVQCFTLAWQDDFEVSAPRYDGTNGLMIWQLKARKRVKAKAYEAFLTDVDEVEMARARVHLIPARAEYAKGATVQAVVKLPRKAVLVEVDRLVIRHLSR